MTWSVAEDTTSERRHEAGSSWVRCLVTPDDSYAGSGELIALGTALGVDYAYEMEAPTPMGGYVPEFVPGSGDGANLGKVLVRRCAGDNNPMEDTAGTTDLSALPFHAWFRVA